MIKNYIDKADPRALIPAFHSMDWKLNISVLFLIFLGLLSLLSTKPELFWKQLVFAAIGIFCSFLVFKFDWRPLINYRGVLLGMYAVIIFLLLITYFFAPSVRGVKAWLLIGPFQFQASEIVKIVLIVMLANFFKKKHVSIARVSNVLISFVYFFIPAALILLQPDLGTVLILFLIWFGFLLVSGLPWRHLAVSLLVFAILGTFMWFSVLKDYQKERILGLFFPASDPLGINYNVIQSKIAIGSAGLFGKGFEQGTQVQLGFLPEAQTDFIFAAIIEEFGLFTGFLAIGVFLFLVLRIIQTGVIADNNFNRFICLGTVILFSSQFFLNVGSNLGLTPVVGVTFPFLSYGGSSLLTNLILIGIIQSIVVRR